PAKPSRRAPTGRAPAHRRSKAAGAVVALDPGRTGLGAPRRADAREALAMTMARLARCDRLGRVVIATPDPGRARALLADSSIDAEVVATEAEAFSRPAVASARALSRASWRGGIANLCVYDEPIGPRALAGAMQAAGLDRALIVGADWALVDPALCDAALDAHARRDDPAAVAFAQAPPGLGACVVGRRLAEEQAANAHHPAVTIGGLLGYHPARPAADPIALDACVRVDPAVRGAVARFIADDPEGAGVIARLGERAAEARADDVVAAWRTAEAPPPWDWTLELAAGRPPHGVAPAFNSAATGPHTLMPAGRARAWLDAIARARPDAAVTFAGAGDPLTHPDLAGLIAHARALGLGAVHVRTPLVADDAVLDALARSAPDVISVDLYANSAATYRAITGADVFRRALEGIDRLRGGRDDGPTLEAPWIVPRITRCAAALDEIEAFYDKWLLVTGAACIDPLPEEVRDGRCAALTVPTLARAARARMSRTVAVADEPPADV
ncbi:MAG: hypothetical protein D6693_00875, partial [Planctomycetota bacterium]